MLILTVIDVLTLFINNKVSRHLQWLQFGAYPCLEVLVLVIEELDHRIHLLVDPKGELNANLGR
jgi:hypothetical protein